MRKLATIRKIHTIRPIPEADAIEVASIDGWDVVVKKGEFQVGQLAIYFEIDSWIPNELAPFLTKAGTEPKVYEGIPGERLRSIRLRKQLSQGLLLPMTTAFVWNEEEGAWEYTTQPAQDVEHFETTVIENSFCIKISFKVFAEEGDDLTEILGIQKWERPLPAQLQGKARGNFPSHIVPKTDQERIQNCFGKIRNRSDEETYEVSLKLDGSSLTVFRFEDVLRVCSRNLELKLEDNAGNAFVDMGLSIGDKIPEGYAVQGELMGPGIQGNRENFSTHMFFVFDVYDIKAHAYMLPQERRRFVASCGLEHVPVLEKTAAAPESVAAGLEMAEGPSIHNKTREGLVWKSNVDNTFSYKTIANSFLLKGGD